MISLSQCAFVPSSFNYVGLGYSIPRRDVFQSLILPQHHCLTTLRMVSSQRAGTAKRRRASNGKRKPQENADRRRKNSQKQSPIQKKIVPIHEANSMGEAIQLAKSISDHLYIAEKFIWLPTDDNLAPHLRTQLVHHEKRRRWGSQLLESLGQAALDEWENNPQEMLKSPWLEEEEHIWTDARFLRMVSSVSQPMTDSIDRPDKEGIYISQALKGLHVLSGCIAPVAPNSPPALEAWIDVHRCISELIHSADKLFTTQNTLLKDAVEVRWAIRGLVARLQMANNGLSHAEGIAIEGGKILYTTPNLNARTNNLPFDILHHCLPWQINPTANDSTSSDYLGYPTKELLSDFIKSIPFNFDTLTTRTGDSVIERRGTAWLAEEGIGALAYSGKLMRPKSIPTAVRETMRHIEQWCYQSDTSSLSQLPSTQKIGDNLEFIWDDSTSSYLPYKELGQFVHADSNSIGGFFDCALTNHYPDGDSACKYHTDPEHGSHWARVTTVVSCGQSRKFAFRPIPDVSIWNDWDTTSQNPKQPKDDTSCAPAALSLFPGDVVFMARDCNDLFHHAVYSSQSSLSDNVDSSRVSLVFKRALDRNGKKGHGLAGEGRRARRNNLL
eukprot:scaffold10454_cov135-Skeletonema_menzelii.AAC.1